MAHGLVSLLNASLLAPVTELQQAGLALPPCSQRLQKPLCPCKLFQQQPDLFSPYCQQFIAEASVEYPIQFPIKWDMKINTHIVHWFTFPAQTQQGRQERH